MQNPIHCRLTRDSPYKNYRDIRPTTGTCDLLDQCPDNPDKTKPLPCGCDDVDTDGDGWQDCEDDCYEDPLVRLLRTR